MTPAEALQYLKVEAKRAGIQMPKTTQARLLYLADLRARRYGCDEISGLTWVRTSNGPFDRSLAYLPQNVTVSELADPEWRAHAAAVVAAYGRLSHQDLGTVCKGSAPMRKSQRDGDVLDLNATSTNDLTAAVTQPPSA